MFFLRRKTYRSDRDIPEDNNNINVNAKLRTSLTDNNCTIDELRFQDSQEVVNYENEQQFQLLGIELELVPPFHEADHIYKYDFAGVIQHHAIVVTSKPDLLIVTEFQAELIHSSFRRKKRPKCNCTLKLQSIPQHEWKRWKKVSYGANFISRAIYRSGTCTYVKQDFPELVLKRVRFLLEYLDNVSTERQMDIERERCEIDDIIPPFHIFKSNSECCAVWCTTGRWHTLQASSFFHSTVAGQAKSTATLALYASSQTVSVPANGIWGMMGFTTKVSLFTAQPFLVPALASYGLISVGGPLWIFKKYKACWNSTTFKLNDLFWSTADNDVFVQCIRKWHY